MYAYVVSIMQVVSKFRALNAWSF